jgi:exodeoxyribonuclease V gamma subunit
MLLQLPQLRITRVEWQSLFEVDAVRKRFGLDTTDVAQIDTWLDSAGVRWGLDTQHRKAWGFESEVDGANQNSWLFGLERLLLGYATGGSNDKALPWQNTLPQAGVGGLDAHVMEGLLKWLHHTQLALLQMRQDHTPTQWVRVLQQLIGLFFQACNDHEERLLERIMAPLETWLNECQLARLRFTTALSGGSRLLGSAVAAICATKTLFWWGCAICDPDADALYSFQDSVLAGHERW